MQTKRKEQTKKLALMALLTALVAVLSYLGGFIKFSIASVSLTLIPMVIGAVLYGMWAGAWLGAVSAIVFFITPDAAWWFGLNAAGTIIIVLAKGIAAGACVGLVFKLVSRVADEVSAVALCAVIAPIVNTGIFLIGCLILFPTVLSVVVIVNFCLELIANVIVCPLIYKTIKQRI